MFEVSRFSWRYRLISGMGWKPNASLCIFFWQLVFSVIFRIVQITFIVVVVSVLTGSAVLGAYWLITSPYFLVVELLSFEEITVESILPSISGTVVVLIMVLGFLWESYFKDKWRYRNRYKEEKQPSLLRSYIKAKKDKVCPRINFKD